MDGEVTCTFPISTHFSFIHSLTLQPLSKYLVSTCPMPNTFLGAGNIAISTLIQVLPHGASVSWAGRVGKSVCLLPVPPNPPPNLLKIEETVYLSSRTDLLPLLALGRIRYRRPMVLTVVCPEAPAGRAGWEGQSPVAKLIGIFSAVGN